jgi:hypothetical protein
MLRRLNTECVDRRIQNGAIDAHLLIGISRQFHIFDWHTLHS